MTRGRYQAGNRRANVAQPFLAKSRRQSRRHEGPPGQLQRRGHSQRRSRQRRRNERRTSSSSSKLAAEQPFPAQAAVQLRYARSRLSVRPQSLLHVRSFHPTVHTLLRTTRTGAHAVILKKARRPKKWRAQLEASSDVRTTSRADRETQGCSINRESKREGSTSRDSGNATRSSVQ